MWSSLASKDSGGQDCQIQEFLIIRDYHLRCIHEEKKDDPKADEEDDSKGEIEVEGSEGGEGGS